MERPYQGRLHDATECAKITPVLHNDYRGQVCSVAGTLELIGERWSILVIREVFYGRRRFSEMQRVLGVARNVLASRLERLVDEGILERRIYSERPERFEYFLTEKGLDLWPVMVSLMHWGDKHLAVSRAASRFGSSTRASAAGPSTTAASASAAARS